MSAAVMSLRGSGVSFRAPVLPWAIAPDDEARFKRIAQRVLITCAIVCIALPWLPVMQPDRSKPQELPLPMAKLILENKPLPPPAAIIKPKIEKAEAQKPVERDVAANKPEPAKAPARRPEAPAKVALNKEAVVPEARVPVPNKP